MKKNNNKISAAFAILLLALPSARAANPQPAILTTLAASEQAVIFPNAEAAPNTQKLATLPPNSFPQGVAYYGSDHALLADYSNSRVEVMQISNGALLATIDTSPAGYDGSGTITVAPDLNTALAMGDNKKLCVIHGPFVRGARLSSLTLPGEIMGLETEAIVFNNAGRAFVQTTAGVSVIDPPYTSIAFTMPPVNGAKNGGAIAITPDGDTLLVTAFSNQVRIYHAPYSKTSVAELVTVPGNSGLDGIAITPDATKAIVCTSSTNVTPRAAAISGPFTANSTVEGLPIPAGSNGFEDVGISADGKLAIITGNGAYPGNNPPEEEAIFVRAPFTAAGAQVSKVAIHNVTDPNRGNGAVRFEPPGLAPGLSVSAAASKDSASLGTHLTYTLTYTNTGSAAATGVVIKDPLPTGTTFISATGGGKFEHENIVFGLGLVPAGAKKSVSFTVDLAAENGGKIVNYNYTIAATDVAPIAGPPVSVSVIGAATTPSRLLNISTRLNVQTGDNVLIGGFIINGSAAKKVIVRGIGPSLAQAGVSGALADPVLELHEPNGNVITNNNWKDTQEAAIQATGLEPKDNLESAIVATLAPAAYTVVLRGNNNGTGVGLVEAYDLASAATSQLANISSRGFVETGDDVLIGGFIVGQSNGGDAIVVVRAIGPSLAQQGSAISALQDPVLNVNDANGNVIGSNDDWRDNQEAQIIADNLAPSDDRESALEITLPSGGYTVIVSGKNNTTGLGLVEVYNIATPAKH